MKPIALSFFIKRNPMGHALIVEQPWLGAKVLLRTFCRPQTSTGSPLSLAIFEQMRQVAWEIFQWMGMAHIDGRW
jgi:hypothetical protein